MRITRDSKTNSGQDVSHHADGHVHDGQSCRVGKLILMMDGVQIGTIVTVILSGQDTRFYSCIVCESNVLFSARNFCLEMSGEYKSS